MQTADLVDYPFSDPVSVYLVSEYQLQKGGYTGEKKVKAKKRSAQEQQEANKRILLSDKAEL